MHDLIPLPADATPIGALVPHEDLETARAFAEHEKAAASRRAYNSDWSIFRSWCAHRDLQPLPASPQAVAAFIAAEAQAGRRAATITRRLAAIRYAHKLAGIGEPPTNSELVRSTMRGIRRTIGTAPAKKAPATAELIAAMLATCRWLQQVTTQLGCGVSASRARHQSAHRCASATSSWNSTTSDCATCGRCCAPSGRPRQARLSRSCSGVTARKCPWR